MILLFLMMAFIIVIFEGVPLFRQKKWKDLTAVGILLGFALFTGIGKALNIPTVIELLERWIRPIGEAIFKRF